MRIILTTSRRPTQRVRSFVKDLYSVIPQAIRINRGKATLNDLASYALEINAEKILVVITRKGNPGSILIYGVDLEGKPIALCRIVISGIKLSREYGGSPCPKTSSIFIDISSIKSELGEQLAEVLIKNLGYVPITSINEATPNSITAIINEKSSNNVVMKYMRLSPRIICGPVIRISKVIKYG